ncbi:MAG: phage integrase N-terminal SAM-like domain-containing protein [Deltaproteobacteria bacterium]|nr:phage integrase N-terminal SAM-like domain-containing protein [Deltaproteobacteria bacterium]
MKSYRSWVRHLQNYTRCKDPRLLSTADVKEFLTFLAVKRNVSALYRNQAFNTFLFLFKNVLKKDFWRNQNGKTIVQVRLPPV